MRISLISMGQIERNNQKLEKLLLISVVDFLNFPLTERLIVLIIYSSVSLIYSVCAQKLHRFCNFSVYSETFPPPNVILGFRNIFFFFFQLLLQRLQ